MTTRPGAWMWWWGAGVLPGLEMEAALGRAKDRQYVPATTYRGLGFGLKWVPLQSDTGWSAGGRLDWGRTRVRDDAAPGRWTEREFALTALATYRLAKRWGCATRWPRA